MLWYHLIALFTSPSVSLVAQTNRDVASHLINLRREHRESYERYMIVHMLEEVHSPALTLNLAV